MTQTSGSGALTLIGKIGALYFELEELSARQHITASVRDEVMRKSIYLRGLMDAAELVLDSEDVEVLRKMQITPTQPNRSDTPPAAMVWGKGLRVTKRCDANARMGTGTGVCNRLLDKHGNCDRADSHVSDAPEIPPGVREADVWDLESGTRDEPQGVGRESTESTSLAEFQRGWREGARWRNQVHAEQPSNERGEPSPPQIPIIPRGRD